MAPKRRMFWKVRATPSPVMMSGRARVTSRVPKMIRPPVGLYRPVSMLKNVVLPAPLGPISETIERSGIVIDTPPTATRPPNSLTTSSARMTAGRGDGACGSAVVLMERRPRRGAAAGGGTGVDELGVLGGDLGRQLEPAPALGEQALGPQHHDDHEQEAEDPERQLGEVEVQPERVRQCVQHVGDHVVVDVGEQQRAEHRSPDRPQPADDDHGQDEDRERELELVGVDRRVVGPQEDTGHAAERGADRVGGQLRAHERDAHRDGRHLVLAQGDPGPPEPRIADPEVDEQDDAA